MRLVEEGRATPGEIDRALTAWGMQIGPFQLADFIGFDVLLDIAQVMERSYGERFRVSPLHKELVAAGRLGKKVGRGVYLYAEHAGEKEAAGSWKRTEQPADQEQSLVGRIVFSLINEAIFCLQEGIASPSDIDLAVVECLRLPKGPLKMAEEMGLATLSEKKEETSDLRPQTSDQKRVQGLMSDV
jgi:3-hydroxyacyl-CoA dehydrogenase